MKTENDLQKDFPSFSKVKEYIECAEKTMFNRYDVCRYLDIVNKSFEERKAASGDIYDILRNWGINRAKPIGKEEFTEIIKKTNISEILDNLKKFTLNDFNGNNAKDIIKNLKLLFDEITLTHCSTKLVFFSKAMHLYLPELIIPMDRKYTMSYLEDTYLLSKKDIEKEFDVCVAYHKLMAILFKNYRTELSKFQLVNDTDKKWPITKLLDHAVIGCAIYEKNECIRYIHSAIQ